MRRELFQPTVEAEARLLLLVDAFTKPSTGLEGRTKLAKLDFLLRNPAYLERALQARTGQEHEVGGAEDAETIEHTMVRYRYGPWDPSYFAVLGRLIGKGLIVSIPTPRGVAYRSTDRGHSTAATISADEAWSATAARVRLLTEHFDLTGESLKRFVYQHFPEVVAAHWGEPV